MKLKMVSLHSPINRCLLHLMDGTAEVNRSEQNHGSANSAWQIEITAALPDLILPELTYSYHTLSPLPYSILDPSRATNPTLQTTTT